MVSPPHHWPPRVATDSHWVSMRHWSPPLSYRRHPTHPFEPHPTPLTPFEPHLTPLTPFDPQWWAAVLLQQRHPQVYLRPYQLRQSHDVRTTTTSHHHRLPPTATDCHRLPTTRHGRRRRCLHTTATPPSPPSLTFRRRGVLWCPRRWAENGPSDEFLPPPPTPEEIATSMRVTGFWARVDRKFSAVKRMGQANMAK